jgi:HEAT repeat protein
MMWDQLIEFLAKNAQFIVIAILSAVAGALLSIILPRLWVMLLRFSEAINALVGGRWIDYLFERKYLAWLIERHRFLGQLPSNIAVATGDQKQLAELEQVYVALSVTPGRVISSEDAPDGITAHRMRRQRPLWWSRFVPLRFRPDAERPFSNIGRSIVQHSRLVIRGDPGSGKTTLMKYIAVTCARALRNLSREGDQREMAYTRLGWKDRPFPIFVSLGRHANVKTWDKGRTLMDAWAEEFDRELAECPPGFFERRLKRGGCIILLDGFDELGAREARQEMAQQIFRLLNKFPNAKNSVVVTTRIVGYEGQFDARGFEVQTIQPLDDQDISGLVHQRYRAIALNESRDRSASEVELAQRRVANKADQLLGEIRRNVRLHSLAVNPLLLSLIVLVHSVRLVLPEELHILYRDCIEILAARWRQSKSAELAISEGEEAELSLSQRIYLLEAIALEMQKQRTREGAGQIPIRRARVEELVAERLPGMLTTLPNDVVQRRVICAQKASAWLDGIKVESGILLEVGLDNAGEPLIIFSHRVFQEYLAAKALLEEPGLSSDLRDNLLNESWEEVVLLYTAIGNPNVKRTNEIYHLLLESVTPSNSRGLLMAGRLLLGGATVGETERLAVLRGLEKLIRTGAVSERMAGCELFMEIGDPSTIQPLAEVMEGDPDEEVRAVARQALDRLGYLRAVDQLIADLYSPDESIRDKAIAELVKNGRFAITPLLEALRDADAQARTSAAIALGQIADPRATDPLIASLNDLDINVRLHATTALGRIRDPRSVASLINLLHDSNSDVVRQAASALRSIGVPAIGSLTEALNDRDTYMRKNVVFTLGIIGTPRALELLTDAVTG